MECMYCNAPLKGFADSRVVIVHGHRCVACADIEACNARVAAEERRRTGLGDDELEAFDPVSNRFKWPEDRR